MRKFQFVIRSFLGAAAFATMVGCEEVDPPKPAPKPVVTTVAPPAPVPVAPPVVEQLGASPLVVNIPVAKAPEKKPIVTVDVGEGSDPKDIIAGARDALTTGELDRAMKLAKLAVQKAPTRSAAWNTLGRTQLKVGQRKDAITSFEKAVELNPKSIWAQNNLGLALIYDGRFEEAVDALEEATDGDQAEGYMFNNLGMAYEHLDRLEEARVAYKKAVAMKTEIAGKNLARLEGVATIRTAKNDTVRSDTTVGKSTDIDLGVPSDLDGGVK
jgi:predicted negative regulator of RcsB-dependent stress response